MRMRPHTTLASIAVIVTNVAANPTSDMSARDVANETQEWMNMSCENPTGNLSDTLTASQWWDFLKVDQAWTYATAKWRTARDAKTNTSEFRNFVMRDVLNGTKCEFEYLADTVNCSRSAMDCDDSKGIKPAVFVLASSFYRIKQLYDTLWEAADITEPTRFISDYITKDTPNHQRMSTSFLYSAAGAVEALTLKKSFELSPWVFDNSTEVRDDLEKTFLAVRNFSFEASAEFLRNGSPHMYLDWVNASSLRQFSRSWVRGSVYAALPRAWSGEDASINFLSTLISGGKLSQLQILPKAEADRIIVKTMQSVWIPYLWKLRGSQPVLVSTGWDCTPDGNLHESQILNPGESRTAEFCVSNKVYYLQDAKGDSDRLAILPEIESIFQVTRRLNGTANPATNETLQLVTLNALVESTIARHNKVGNRALWGLPESEEDKTSWHALWKEIIAGGGDILLPAVSNVPMCDEPTVKRNRDRLSKGEKLDMTVYPCNEKEEKSNGAGVSRVISPCYMMILGAISLLLVV